MSPYRAPEGHERLAVLGARRATGTEAPGDGREPGAPRRLWPHLRGGPLLLPTIQRDAREAPHRRSRGSPMSTTAPPVPAARPSFLRANFPLIAFAVGAVGVAAA